MASMEVKMVGVTESGDEKKLKSTPGGLLVPGSLDLFWTAKGYGFQAMATAAVAALVVRPTTVAMATLRNKSTNKVLVIERAFAHNLVGTANSVYSIYLCVHPVGMAAVTNDITVRNRTNGKSAGGSEADFDNGATVTDDGWFPWSKSEHTVTITTPGGVVIAEVNKRIVIPSTAGISLQVVADVAGATFTPGFHWYEVPEAELDLN